MKEYERPGTSSTASERLTLRVPASLTYGSVCSGIEAATVAWKPLGWRCAFASEIEAFPRAVLQHRHPGIPLHGDFTTIRADEYDPIDVLVGGTPCQSFSVAGLRGGLDDDRGNLALEYLRLADRLRPRWLVWENVPGVLSSNKGGDFGSILGGMGELGYGLAYRVLDAQFFRLAQRRRRVFVVGYLGDWRRAAAVLFERHSLSGHPAPSREAGEGTPCRPTLRARANSSHRADSQAYIAGTLNANGKAAGSATSQDAESGLLISAYQATGNSFWRPGIGPLAASDDNGSNQLIAHTLKGEGFDASEDGAGRGTPIVPVMTFALRGREGGAMAELGGEVSNALRTPKGGASVPMVFDPNQVTSKANRSTITPGLCHTLPAKGEPPTAFNITPSNSNKDYNARPSDRAQAVTAGGNRPSARGGDLIAGSAVRRLTPRECERLQGFPDDYTLIPWRKGEAADGPRYKALGNSMAVPVMAWIGQRIALVDALSGEPSYEPANPNDSNGLTPTLPNPQGYGR